MTLNKGSATTPCKEIVEGRQPPVFAADLQQLERWIYSDASVPYGGRQEFEIPDLQVPLLIPPPSSASPAELSLNVQRKIVKKL